MNFLVSSTPDPTPAPPVQSTSPAVDCNCSLFARMGNPCKPDCVPEPDEDCEELQPFVPVLAWW